MSRFWGRLLALVFMITVVETAAGEQWYRSNAAGMILERIPSRLAALRNTYCLSIEFVFSRELPEYLQEYLRPSYQIEVHTLYEKGNESRRRWIFKDPAGTVRLVSSMNNSPAAEKAPVEPIEEASLEEEVAPKAAPTGISPKGFIEIYDEYNLIIEERQFSSEGSESITHYFYNRQVLVKAEIRLKVPAPAESESGEPVITLIATDNYRYSRSNALRAVERVYHASDTKGENRLARLQFPHLGMNTWVDETFITPSTPYKSEFLQDIIMDFDTKPGDRVVYTTDGRGKVLTETRRDAEGEIRGEIRNIWTGDRLEAIEWKDKEDERRTEYEYDSAGDRILERNYNKGVLERTVRWEQGQEIEELYMNGVVILRAVWEEGRKISEERVRSSRKMEDKP